MKNKFIILLSAFLLFITVAPLEAQDNKVEFFYSETCSHCEKEKAWLKTLEDDYEVQYIDINKDADYFEETIIKYEIQIPVTPLLIYQGQVFSGYITKDDFLAQSNQAGPACDLTGSSCEKSWTEKAPLVVSAIIFGLMDGFNPCALWVLIIMITFLLQVENTRRLKILGAAFILSTALMYYFILNSWIHIAPLLKQVPFFTKLIALAILVFGIKSLYDLKQEQGCEIEQSAFRKKAILKLDQASSHSSLAVALLVVIALALFVNLLELGCSLGFPLAFIELMDVNAISQSKRQVYLLIYVFFFVLDDLIVLLFAIKNKKLKAFSSQHKKKIQDVSSLVLIVMALILLLKPSLLNF